MVVERNGGVSGRVGLEDQSLARRNGGVQRLEHERMTFVILEFFTLLYGIGRWMKRWVLLPFNVFSMLFEGAWKAFNGEFY